MLKVQILPDAVFAGPPKVSRSQVLHAMHLRMILFLNWEAPRQALLGLRLATWRLHKTHWEKAPLDWLIINDAPCWHGRLMLPACTGILNMLCARKSITENHIVLRLCWQQRNANKHDGLPRKIAGRLMFAGWLKFVSVGGKYYTKITAAEAAGCNMLWPDPGQGHLTLQQLTPRPR